MKKNSVFLLVPAWVLFLNISCTNRYELFLQDSNDWKAHGDASWSFSDNQLVGEVKNGAGFIMTRESYQDFVLDLEFKPDSSINSGVFIRCSKKEINPTDCHELNIWDLHPNQDYRTGAIVTKATPKSYIETVDKWNTYKIKAEKNRIHVWVNDILMADAEYENPSQGYIGLQAMGTGKISFRNVRLTLIKK